MIITSSINIDLARMGVIPPIYAIQDDKYSRNLEVNLYSNGVPWIPPEEFNAFACYKKGDGIGGEYDTMPDGTKAWNIENNVLTFALAPQVLTVPGKVDFSIRMISEISELSTFIIPIVVEPRPDFEVDSEEYVNMRNWLVSELYDALRLAKESGEFVGPRGPQGVPGVDGKSAYQYATEAGYVGTEAEFSCKLSVPFIVPQMYGAKGDGSTNDTTAFQNALENNRVVRVPGGTYILSDTLVIGENCCMELSQDTHLKFTQTSGNCIEMRGSSVLRGNHAVISAAYGLTGNVISMDTSLDGNNHASIPPYAKADPQWKRQRFVYDVNIVKPNSAGFNRPLDDGKCNGTAIYASATNVSNDSTDIAFMWGITMSGIRIAGGFAYGIHAINYDSADGSTGHYTDDAWNHDMRIEAIIEGCEVGVALENCNGAHLNVTVQPNTTPGGTKYAKQGVCLKDSRFVDMMRSRVWDWQYARDDSEEYKHIALYGNCRGLLLDDFLVTEHPDIDIRDDIYTDTPSNFDTMTILQEPANKWFKSIDNKPHFFDGTANRKLMLATDKFTAEQAEFISPADGYYTYEPNFTNLVEGYTDGVYLADGSLASLSGYVTTDFIPIDGAAVHTYRIGGDGIVWGGDEGSAEDEYCRIEWYDADKNQKGATMAAKWIDGGQYYPVSVEDETVAAAFATNANVVPPNGAAYFRITAKGSGANLVVTLDEKQEYNAIWHGDPKRLDESIYAKNVSLTSPSGKTFKLLVSNSGTITAEEFTE